jgi:hypothetical protein
VSGQLVNILIQNKQNTFLDFSYLFVAYFVIFKHFFVVAQ